METKNGAFFQEGSIVFKSYYVVWKLGDKFKGIFDEVRLNRTM